MLKALKIFSITTILLLFLGFIFSNLDLSVLYNDKHRDISSQKLYSIYENDIYIEANNCPLKTHKEIIFKNIQLCMWSEYKEIQNTNNNTLMISRGEDGTQIVIIPATDFTSLISYANNINETQKNDAEFSKYFGNRIIKDMYTYDNAALKINHNKLSVFNNYIHNALIYDLLERKDELLYKADTISKFPFQI